MGRGDGQNRIIVSDIEEDRHRDADYWSRGTVQGDRNAGIGRIDARKESGKSGDSGEEWDSGNGSGVVVNEDEDSVRRDTERIEAGGKKRATSASHAHRRDEPSWYGAQSAEEGMAWLYRSETPEGDKGQKKSNQSLRIDPSPLLFSDGEDRDPSRIISTAG